MELSIIIFRDIYDDNLKLVSQQYRSRSDCTDVQTGLALYRFLRLAAFGSSKVRVKKW